MPVSRVAKCTFFYQQNEHGWSETYYTEKTIEEAYDACIPLGDALIAIRGKNTAITGLRISLVPSPTNQGAANRITQLFPPRPGWSVGGAVISPAITGQNESDSFTTCVLARAVPLGGSAIGTKSIFMGGFPDIYAQNGGVLVGTFQYFFGIAPIRTLQRALTQGAFGWLGQTANPVAVTARIETLTYSTGNVPTLKPYTDIFANSTGIKGASGVYVPVQITGVKTPGNLNGIWPGSVASDGKVTLKKPFAHLTWDSTGSISYRPKALILFSNQTVGMTPVSQTEPDGNLYALKVAKRKRGRPFGQQPGRAKIKPVS